MTNDPNSIFIGSAAEVAGHIDSVIEKTGAFTAENTKLAEELTLEKNALDAELELLNEESLEIARQSKQSELIFNQITQQKL